MAENSNNEMEEENNMVIQDWENKLIKSRIENILIDADLQLAQIKYTTEMTTNFNSENINVLLQQVDNMKAYMDQVIIKLYKKHAINHGCKREEYTAILDHVVAEIESDEPYVCNCCGVELVEPPAEILHPRRRH